MVKGLVLSAQLFCAGLTFAAPGETQPEVSEVLHVELGKDIGIVDQVVSVPFEPSQGYVLIERGIGQVHRYPAAIRRTGDVGIQAEGKEEVLIAAKVPVDSAGSLYWRFHLSFFLSDRGSSFAATPVAVWTRDEVLANTGDTEELIGETANLVRQIQAKRKEVAELDEKLRTLRIRASSVAGIDEIVTLKTELEHLQDVGRDSRAEIARLQELIALSRTQADPPDVNERRRDLTLHLAEAAKATAMADRLNKRRRDAAVAGVQKKLAVIRSAKGLDATALAREVLKLRSQRRALEARMNPAGSGVSDEF